MNCNGYRGPFRPLTKDEQRDEDDAIDREWLRIRALVWSINGNMPIEVAKWKSFEATNAMRVAFGQVPLEAPP